jgi:malate synthase
MRESVTDRPALQVEGPLGPTYEQLLSPDALRFVGELCARFAPRLEELLERRRERQARFDQGERPDFLPETRRVREGDWQVAPVPAALADRRVEITGPVDRKMIINALNSGAKVFMADFEDANAPTWRNVVEGQLHLRDAVQRTIDFEAPGGKRYALGPQVATLMVRPRGLHLPERHLTLKGRFVPGALVDFGLFFFHNAKALHARGEGPFFYLPKLQSHLEARWWNEVFVAAQKSAGLPLGTVKATVLIETLPAAFEMHEILYELRQHSAGLNCGRWDYIFSFIKTLRADPAALLPDRGQVTMTQPFLRAYSQLLIQTCHRRGAHAMGGMAAQIPIKDDPARNQAAMEKVRADKLREVQDGHDGTWVAHPGLVPVAQAVFDQQMSGPNQLGRLREEVQVTQAELLAVPQGTRTEAGLRHNLNVGIRYLEAWLGGLGCVPLDDLMEDAATAEISRIQVWQWLRHRARLDDGREVTPALFRQVLEEELVKLRAQVGPARFESGGFQRARQLFEELCTAEVLADFLTLSAYDALVGLERAS